MHRHANWPLKSWQQLLSSGDAEGACCSLAFFLCFRWMIVQLQEGEKERNLLTAIHPLPVPTPGCSCVFLEPVEMGTSCSQDVLIGGNWAGFAFQSAPWTDRLPSKCLH